MKKMFRIQKDERQTGYLFGTMHTLNVDIERFSGLTEIISKTERLYTENCDLNILNKRYDMNAEEINEIVDKLKLINFDHKIIDYCSKLNIEHLYIEPPISDSLGEETTDQIFEIAENINHKHIDQMTQIMLPFYKMILKNLNEFCVTTLEQIESAIENKDILQTRNKIMFETIDKIDSENNLICVGIGHLFGIINLLRENGYIVEQISIELDDKIIEKNEFSQQISLLINSM